ncbi:MAG TPA: hypothetical protein VFQ41_17235 [Candidatus Angelobacter sp.]|nr:hypothetical protein [Candidatus Angelobacter sp.]
MEKPFSVFSVMAFALVKAIFKALPVYAPRIGAAEEILELIYVEFYFGNFQLRTEAPRKRAAR